MNAISFTQLWVVLVLVLLTKGTTAQNNQIRNYTLADGLPQSQVYDIVQDEVGYLWVGSQGGGLSSFDGLQFNVWNERNGLLSNYIQTLQFIGDRLFIGTREGLSVKYKNTFINYEGPQINTMIQTDDGIVLGTNNGLYSYTQTAGISSLPITVFGSQATINDILFDGDWYWIASSKGLWKSKSISAKTAAITKVYEGNFTSLVQYKKRVFAAEFSKGIFLFEGKSATPTVFPIAERINNVSLLNTNELWIATDTSGIVVMHATLLYEIEKIGPAQGLSVKHIRTCFKDRQANIWIATSGGGLYRYFQNNFRHYDKDTGLKGNRVYAVHHDKNDAIWASNSENGLVKIDSLGVHEIENDTSLVGVKVKTLASGRTGRIWAGTDGKGIFIIDEQVRDSIVTNEIIDFQSLNTIQIKETSIEHFSVNDGLPSKWIKKIIIQDQFIWVASYASGIAKIKYGKTGLVVSQVFGSADGIQDLVINDLALDASGALWYATKSGHLGYIYKGQVTHLGAVLEMNVSIGSLIFDSETIYVGTSGKGVWVSNTSRPLTFRKLRGAKDLYSENIYQLLFDDDHHLWVGTERGVDKLVLDKKNEIVDAIHFGRNNGFLGIETCLNAVTKDATGSLWFGTIYGLTKYQPTEGKQILRKPQLNFEDVEVSYKSIDSINLKQWTNNASKILQLQPTDNNLAFRYRTVDISHPNEIKYRHRLNDAQWSPWSSENKITFASLDYGDYTFEAQSRNMAWQKSDPIRFAFHVDRPLHKKVWFQRLSFIALGVFFVLLVMLFVLRLKKKAAKERQQLELENHLLSLEQKALRLQMNPHFIFNVLNGIKAMGEYDTQKRNTTINKFAKLLRATLNNSRVQHIDLAQEIETLKNYIEVEQIMAPKPFDYAIDIACDIDTEEVLIPPMLIQPFVENAIKHGIMSTNKPGKLKVTFAIVGEFLSCTIEDNGIGIHQAQQNKTNTDHQSMALRVTKERIVSISGKDTLVIEDLGDENETQSGTRVVFQIPLLTDY
jgi:ligand-binding sensor domain-containing protein/signal transduction histidine kinase